MNRPDVSVEEPLFLDEPEDLTRRDPPAASPIHELFADESGPAQGPPLPSAGAFPAAWRAERGSNAAQDRLRTPLLVSLVALGILIGFSLVSFLR